MKNGFCSFDINNLYKFAPGVQILEKFKLKQISKLGK